MTLTIAQLYVSKDIPTNVNKILEVINKSFNDSFIIFPEGILSGYYPEDENYLHNMNVNLIKEGILKIKKILASKKCSIIFGTAYQENNEWFNASIYLNNEKEFIYKKVNLSTLDRNHFHRGNNLNVFENNNVKFGIQMCRDNAFPEQWKILKQKGAQILFHPNNAIKEIDIIRKHLLISRAFENQYFVCSVNNAANTQTLPSFIISPLGEILFESKVKQEQISEVEINLNEVRNDYYNQERKDLIKVELLNK